MYLYRAPKFGSLLQIGIDPILPIYIVEMFGARRVTFRVLGVSILFSIVFLYFFVNSVHKLGSNANAGRFEDGPKNSKISSKRSGVDLVVVEEHHEG